MRSLSLTEKPRLGVPGLRPLVSSYIPEGRDKRQLAMALRCIKGNVGPFVYHDIYHGILSVRADLSPGVWVLVDGQWQEHAASLFEPCNPEHRGKFPHLRLRLLTPEQVSA